ncbi:hypothetical protein HYH02_012089 [Chlamydomonas schloesseri]|uniref:Uncharacterized protein n=1 Tax=Chlamydomonas schloesseri TaxID=2026947 RepID=A0A835SXA3_9CHLO|nr:hypothetical protein HYH02_012089 [Chlamydomonas schloesseri]|eukprot:KAG2434889.1 hypothetical protein HYH02_012089 [Chlamydomonas schloesseri]
MSRVIRRVQRHADGTWRTANGAIVPGGPPILSKTAIRDGPNFHTPLRPITDTRARYHPDYKLNCHAPEQPLIGDVQFQQLDGTTLDIDITWLCFPADEFARRCRLGQELDVFPRAPGRRRCLDSALLSAAGPEQQLTFADRVADKMRRAPAPLPHHVAQQLQEDRQRLQQEQQRLQQAGEAWAVAAEARRQERLTQLREEAGRRQALQAAEAVAEAARAKQARKEAFWRRVLASQMEAAASPCDVASCGSDSASASTSASGSRRTSVAGGCDDLHSPPVAC